MRSISNIYFQWYIILFHIFYILLKCIIFLESHNKFVNQDGWSNNMMHGNDYYRL
jgi:hypothetical protein